MKTFDEMMRQAEILSKASILPMLFRGEASNCYVACVRAEEFSVSPIAMMDAIVMLGSDGVPMIKTQFLIAQFNQKSDYQPILFKMEGEGKKRKCTAFAINKTTGKKETGTTVSLQMAKSEEWTNNSKWSTMPDQMLKYRAATFLISTLAPEIKNGMRTDTENDDITENEKSQEKKVLDFGVNSPNDSDGPFVKGKQIEKTPAEEKKMSINCGF
jgi:hypothetical protein